MKAFCADEREREREEMRTAVTPCLEFQAFTVAEGSFEGKLKEPTSKICTLPSPEDLGLKMTA